MKFIVWAIVIFLVIRMLRKRFFASVHRTYQAQMNEQQRRQQEATRKAEGTVTIEQTKNSNAAKKNGSNEGDYVDYEEVK